MTGMTSGGTGKSTMGRVFKSREWDQRAIEHKRDIDSNVLHPMINIKVG